MTATSIFYIQSVNHLEKIHEVRLAYWNTLPLLAPVRFRTSYDGRKSTQKYEKVRFSGSVQKYYFLTKPCDYYFNDENDVYVYLALLTPAFICVLMARIIAVNGPLRVHCPYVV